MHRLLGLETEYGLYVEGVDVSDLADEARAVVQSFSGPCAKRWDYRDEDPLKDARGFRATQLTFNPEDIKYEKPTGKHLSAREDHVDHILTNGARLYHDHAHPEYSTPECRTLADLVAHDKAGERIVWACAQTRARQAHREISIYKNNTDFHGMSYGTHENYLVRRDLPFDWLITALLPFFVTRPLFAGAGKVGCEDSRVQGVPFQLSQRADFFTEICSVDTLHRRPLINARDEPHTDPRMYRRLHVIMGDANMSEYATALKVGTTSLVLSAFEQGFLPTIVLRDPVRAIKEVSRHLSGPWLVELDDGRTMGAIEIQRTYLKAAQERFVERDDETKWILKEWETVLNDLETDSSRLADRVDWAAKRQLLESFIESENLSWQDEALFSLDLEYHNIDPERGLYYALEQQGAMRRFVTDQKVRDATEHAPSDTRACLRGECVRKFGKFIEALNWGRIWLNHEDKIVEINLRNAFDGRVKDLYREINESSTLAELVRKIVQK
ncbi:proteasome accessory factor PafA2 family protein [Candidatus Acetothermia bacterium]|nr:proteasome accessory factor PafA2 family protein [Candidatus Acetothermia bacterium]